MLVSAVFDCGFSSIVGWGNVAESVVSFIRPHCVSNADGFRLRINAPLINRGKDNQKSKRGNQLKIFFKVKSKSQVKKSSQDRKTAHWKTENRASREAAKRGQRAAGRDETQVNKKY